MLIRELVICAAIRERTLLAFDYEGHPRVVAPYCYGFSPKRVELVRAIQVAGKSRSGGFGFGKLWQVAKMVNVRATDVHFAPNDPNYNPDDSALAEILCRI